MVLLAYISWATAAALKLSTVARMSWNGLIKRFPLVALFLGFCAVRSLVLMNLRGNHHWYKTVFSITLPFALMAEGAAILAVFWAVAVNYPNFRTFGSLLLTILGVGGAIAAWSSYALSIPQSTLRDTMLLFQQSSSMFMVIILAGSRLALPRSNRIPIPKVAQRAADIFLLDVLVGVASAYFIRRYGFEYPALVNTASLLPEVMIGILWLIAMNPVEEYKDTTSSINLPDSASGDLRFARGR